MLCIFLRVVRLLSYQEIRNLLKNDEVHTKIEHRSEPYDLYGEAI